MITWERTEAIGTWQRVRRPHQWLLWVRRSQMPCPAVQPLPLAFILGMPLWLWGLGSSLEDPAALILLSIALPCSDFPFWGQPREQPWNPIRQCHDSHLVPCHQGGSWHPPSHVTPLWPLAAFHLGSGERITWAKSTGRLYLTLFTEGFYFR